MDELKELKIIMVAPRGIGKTSLLAAMHEEFDKTFEQANLTTWTTDSKTLVAIDECKQILRQIDPRLKTKVTPTPIQDDPWNDEGFMFEIGSGNKKFMKLRFTDPSGEYLKLGAIQDQKEYVKQQLNECDAVVIPIDATALMQKKNGKVNEHEIGDWHEEKNAPKRITALLKDAYTSLTVPRLIILAPIKCETYMRTPKDANDLLNHVKLGYHQLLEFFKSDELFNKIAVVVTPVQTIGNVTFAYWTHDPTEPGFTKFDYYKTPINAPYAPQDGEQPLRYILRFLLNVYVETKKEQLENDKKSLAMFEDQLDKRNRDLESAKKELNEKEYSLKKRNQMWWLFRDIANLFDDKNFSYEAANNKFKKSKACFHESQANFDEIQTKVRATQEQIEAFNNAVFNFAIGCKDRDGFAVLQGKQKWLPVPRQIG
jgi:GTPase SAR1 family protein